MENPTQYAIQGLVLDRTTRRGVRGARVEAWDRDTLYHDMLGQVVTNEQGEFTIAYNSLYFGNAKPDRGPDVYFKVYLGGREVLSTFDQPAMNTAEGTLQVTLELDAAAPAPAPAPPQGTDRVSARQAIKMADWWRASDFKGVRKEAGAKSSTVSKLLGNIFGKALDDFELDPVQPDGVREGDVVNQDVTQAQTTLALQQVEVTEVKSVSSSGAGTHLSNLKDYPLQLKAGDRVTLYEQDGKVQYYTLVRQTESAQVDGQTVARIDDELQTLKAQVRAVDSLRTDVDNLKGVDSTVEQRLSESAAGVRARDEEVARLKRELGEVRKAAAGKEAELVQLRADLVAVRAATDSLSARLPLSRLEALEQQLSRMGAAAPVARAARARKPAGAAAGPAAAVRKSGGTAEAVKPAADPVKHSAKAASRKKPR
jgi:hypothetical protein